VKRRIALCAAASLLPPASQALASAAALPLGDGASAEVRRVRALLTVGADATRLVWEGEVESDAGGYAVILPVGRQGDPGKPGDPDAADIEGLDAVDEATAPRWVQYSSGCGSRILGGAAPEDAVDAHLVDDRSPTAAAGEVTVSLFEGRPEELVADLATEGWGTGEAADVASLEDGAFVVMRTADAPVDGGARVAVAVEVAEPELDVRLLPRRARHTVEVILLVVADGQMALEGVPGGRMDPPGAAPAVPGDIGLTYAGWLADRVQAVGDGGPAALLEYAGPVVHGGQTRYATRFHIVLPPASGATRLRLTANASGERHRVRTIVSGGALASPGGRGGGPGPSLLAALAALLALASIRRARWVLRSSAAVVALLMLAGCPSLSHFQGARTAPAGTHEWTAALGVARDVRHDLNTAPPTEGRSHTPRGLLPELAYRYGWRQDADVGLRMSLGGVKGDVRLQLLEQADRGVNLTAALGLSAFVLPFQGDQCAPALQGDDQDGCFTSLFWGGMADVPFTVSRSVGGLEVYMGLRFAYLVVTGETAYSDPTGGFDDVAVSKSVHRFLTGPIFGVVVDVGEGVRVVPEIQVMSSRNAAGDLIWYPVPGLAVSVSG